MLKQNREGNIKMTSAQLAEDRIYLVAYEGTYLTQMGGGEVQNAAGKGK